MRYFIFLFLLLLQTTVASELISLELESSAKHNRVTLQKTIPSGEMGCIEGGYLSNAPILGYPFFRKVLPNCTDVRVNAIYEDGTKEDVTDKARIKNKGGKFFNSDECQLVFSRVGNAAVFARYKGLKSNTLVFEVVKDENVIRTRVIRNSKVEDGVLRVALLKSWAVDVTLSAKNWSNKKEKKVQDSSKHLGYHGTYSRSFNLKDLGFGRGDKGEVKIHVTNLKSGVVYEKVVNISAPLSPKLIRPYPSQLRGAVRGSHILFRVLSHQRDLEYRLMTPIKGMRILGPTKLTALSDAEERGYKLERDYKIGRDDYMVKDYFNHLAGVNIVWDVPMDAKERVYLVTVEAKDVEGQRDVISFKIKVPKTTPIQTEVVNNELIVTDTTSRLYGMKMKGHHGEDISTMKLRSVAYRDLWKKHLELDKGDIPEYVPFVIYNMPEKLDIKFPEFIDTLAEARKVKAKFIRPKKVDLIVSTSNYWKGAFNYFDYDGTNGSIVLNTSDKNTNLFLIVITKPQNIVD